MAGKKYWEENRVSGTELMAMRMMRGKTVKDMARMYRRFKGKVKDYTAYEMEWFEKNADDCPLDLVEFYMTKLGITRSHMAQFKKILKGKLKTFEEGREIAQPIKHEVRKKYKNKCAECKSTKQLHFHHKEHFSKGGQNTVENLILLCAKCHAEEHKGERAYFMLKKNAMG